MDYGPEQPFAGTLLKGNPLNRGCLAARQQRHSITRVAFQPSGEF